MRLIDADKADVERIDCFYGGECRIEDVREWLDEQPTVNPYEWISVEDRLPEDNINCLVFLPEGHLYTGIHIAHYSDKHNMWVDLDRTYLFDHPTHWMPIPTPPTEKEN